MGGSGNDTFHAEDGKRDFIYCGRGKDVVVADEGRAGAPRDFLDDSCDGEEGA